jgi:hypothetical protein
MCLVLYLGSDKRRPLIAWDEAAPRFHVKDDDDDAKKASTHLRKSHVYYVGSDNGCGCGFRQEHDSMIDDAEQLASKTDNQTLLHEYINRCLADEDSIELYSCWSGDEAQPMEFDRTICVDELIDSDFWFAERQRTIVVQHTKT